MTAFGPTLSEHIVHLPPISATQGIQGYISFVKLWDLTEAASAELTRHAIDALDATLLAACGDDVQRWFPSPYGGAIILSDLAVILAAASRTIRELSHAGFSASVAITFGRCQSIYNVQRWTIIGDPVNRAARIASHEDVRDRVALEATVVRDVLDAGTHNIRLGKPLRRSVKNYEFTMQRVLNDDFNPPPGRRRESPAASAVSTSAAFVVAFDIEGFTKRPQNEQIKVVERLSTLLVLAEDGLQERLCFGPAGDGGYYVFDHAAAAWRFAVFLRKAARRNDVSLRIGVSRGTIAAASQATRSPLRRAVGGAILRADTISGLAIPNEIAVDKDFWELLDGERQTEWSASPIAERPDTLRLTAAYACGSLAATTRLDATDEAMKAPYVTARPDPLAPRYHSRINPISAE